MSKDVVINRDLKLKKISRDIVKEILDYGVVESQKFDIINMIALTLENNDAMKDICKVLKNYTTTFNNEKNDNNVTNNKIILT